MKEIKNAIAVASGKGGVGKSSTAVMMALSMKEMGLKVGLLDADIYGPSISIIMGVSQDTKPVIKNDKFFEPVEINDIKTMSMSYLVAESTPVVWRGPMASSALQQMMQQTLWGELDYLIIDLPPGTGDIHLTISQKIKLTGAVIITTPQEVALADVRKAIEMFQKVDVPLIGLIENMSTHICNYCGCQSDIFGRGGGEKLSQQYGLSMLGRLPLDAEFTESLVSKKNSKASRSSISFNEEFRQIVSNIFCQIENYDNSETNVVFE